MAGKATRNKGRRGQQAVSELEHMRRCLIRHLLRLHRERGNEWLREYVEGWRMWAEELSVDFWAQQRLGNCGEHGKWL